MGKINAGLAAYIKAKGRPVTRSMQNKVKKTVPKGTTTPNKFSGKKNVTGNNVRPTVGSKMKKLMGFK